VVRPREKARLTVRLRRTEFTPSTSEGRTLPAVAADLVTVTGRTDMIRLWPTLEAGVFEGDVVADDAGLHNVRVRTDGGASADTSLIVDANSPAPPGDGFALESVPELTGGVTAEADNLDPLVQHLARIPASRRDVVVYPLRSGWWMAPFALALCGEWALRRRRGAR
jgi:hypothetical protein